MALTYWFRKNKKYLLAALVVILMVGWGMMGAIRGLVGDQEGPWGTIGDEVIGNAQMNRAYRALQVGAALRLWGFQNLRSQQMASAPPRALAAVTALSGPVAEFVFQGEEPRLETMPTWRFLVLERRAMAAGVEVTQKEAAELLTLSPVLWTSQGVSVPAFRRMLSAIGMSEPAMAEVLKRLVAVAKFVNLRRESVRLSDAEAWATWAYQNRERKVRLAAVDASLFEPLVEVGDRELHAFYERYKDRLPDPAAGEPGYKGPAQARVECAVPPVDELEQQVEVTGAEVNDYYEENKSEFLEEVPEAESEAEQGQEEPEKEDQTGQEQDGPPEGYRYRPLEEVEEEIRRRLREKKARSRAEELVEKVMDELNAVRENYAHQRLPLAQMARRHGLEHRVASTEEGRSFLSREEISRRVPGGQQVAEFVFGAEGSLYYPRRFSGEEAPVICQVFGRRESEPRPFAEVAGQVRADYRRRAAVERATKFAEKMKSAVAEAGFQAGVAAMRERLRNLLADAGVEAPESPLPITETGFFARNDRTVPELEGLHRQLVEAAFELEEDRPGLVVEKAPEPKCYVLQLIQQRDAPSESFASAGPFTRLQYRAAKQQRLQKRWMEGLLAEAELYRKTGG